METTQAWHRSRPAAIAAAAGAALLALAACSRQEAAPEPIRAVRTMTVGSASAGASGAHEYAAEVRARTESRLGFRVGGKVLERKVNVGDAVRAGQVLARLDAQDLKLGWEAARAGAQAAEVQAAQAAADLRRFQDLQQKGFISTAELERRESSFKAAQAQWDQAKAQANVQINQAGYTALVADAAGVVTATMGEPGMVVAAGAPIVQVALDGPVDAAFAVPEDRIGPLRALLGKPGAIKVRPWSGSGENGQPLAATLREVAAAADPATRTFAAKADLGRSTLRLGQTVTVLVDRPTLSGIARLPLAAVLEQQGKPAVWLLDSASMTVKLQPIAVAGAEGNEVIVAGGLTAGQEVVTAGVHVLTPGQKVKRYATGPAAAR